MCAHLLSTVTPCIIFLLFDNILSILFLISQSGLVHIDLRCCRIVQRSSSEDCIFHFCHQSRVFLQFLLVVVAYLDIKVFDYECVNCLMSLERLCQFLVNPFYFFFFLVTGVSKVYIILTFLDLLYNEKYGIT